MHGKDTQKRHGKIHRKKTWKKRHGKRHEKKTRKISIFKKPGKVIKMCDSSTIS